MPLRRAHCSCIKFRDIGIACLSRVFEVRKPNIVSWELERRWRPNKSTQQAMRLCFSASLGESFRNIFLCVIRSIGPTSCFYFPPNALHLLIRMYSLPRRVCSHDYHLPSAQIVSRVIREARISATDRSAHTGSRPTVQVGGATGSVTKTGATTTVGPATPTTPTTKTNITETARVIMAVQIVTVSSNATVIALIVKGASRTSGFEKRRRTTSQKKEGVSTAIRATRIGGVVGALRQIFTGIVAAAAVTESRHGGMVRTMMVEPSRQGLGAAG